MELSGVPGDPFAGYLVDDSDLEYSDCSDGSSEDEGCTLSSLTRGVGGVGHHHHRQDDHSSEDEFEKEMAGEVRSALELMVSPAVSVPARPARSVGSGGPGPSSTRPVHGNTSHPSAKTSSSAQQSQYYDEVYFDSSGSSSNEEDSGTRGQEGAEGMETNARATSSTGGRGRRARGRKFKKLSNDELFYDPNMDDEDEKWVRRQRMAYHNVKVSEELTAKKKARLAQEKKRQQQDPDVGGGASSQPPPSGGVAMPKSDAVLNCPACMTTLCLDCQRHDTYANQYRAMFVLNCLVLKEEVLTYVPKPDRKSRKRQRLARKAGEETTTAVDPSSENKYHPVRCKNCNTEVAVVDTDELFHFFNVLPSAAS